MKNLKYIFALSSVFVSLFAFGYNVNLTNSSTSNFDNDQDESNDQNDLVLSDEAKENIIETYNKTLEKNHTLDLRKGNLIYKNNNKPVSLDFTGMFSLSSNSLNSYVIDASYTYNSNKENFQVTSGNLDYSTITHDDKVYLFSTSNELSGILSFPASYDSKYPIINLDYKFSNVFDTFLNINELNFKVYTSLNGYSFISDDTKITVDNNFNLVEVKSNYNEDFSYYLNFEELDTSSSSKAIKNSENFVSTLKGLFDYKDFDISYEASINSKSNYLKYNGFVTSLNNSLSLNVNEYINNSLQNEITSTFKDENIYFNLNNGKEKGNLIDSEESDLVDATSGLMSNNSEFDISFSAPLNALINTNIFKNIMNLDLTSSDIKDLSEVGSLKTFKVNSKAFGFTEDFDIRFELELINESLKSISIKDFKSKSNSLMDIKFNINKKSSNKVVINSEAYPLYNSLLPYYKKVVFVVNDLKIGGTFQTSIIDNDGTLGLSTHYDLNLGNSFENISLKTLSAAITDLNINYKDKNDTSTTSTLTNALFLNDTSSESKSSFDLSIKSINYKNEKFYILLDDNGSKYTLENKSIKSLINTVQKLTGSTTTKTNSTNKGFDLIKQEINGITNLIKNISKSEVYQSIVSLVKQGKFDVLAKYLSLEVGSKDVSITIKVDELIKDKTISEAIGYSKNTDIKITLSKNDASLVSISVSDISIADSSNKVSSTSITLNDFKEDYMITDKQISDNWENTAEEPNKSKDLNQVVERISNILDVYTKYQSQLSNASLSNLISIGFAYNKLKLNGKLSSILHFDESQKIDEKYIEAYLPFVFSEDNTKGTNDVTGASLSLVYSDKDKTNSNLTKLVNNENRLVAGTQASVSLYYGDVAQKYNKNTTLNAYSNNETLLTVLEAINRIDPNNNVLASYNVLNTIQNLTSKILSAISDKDKDILKELLNSGVISISTLTKLLNCLDSTSTSFDINLDLSKFTDDPTLSKMNIFIKLNLKIENDTVSITSLTAKDNEGNLDLEIKIDQSIVNKDTTNGTDVNKIGDIIEGFSPKGTDGINYVDMSNLINLIDLGVTTTNKKYHSLSGTFDIKDNIIINVAPLNINDVDLGEKLKPINALTFNLQLEFYKDSSSNDETSKLKSYLSIENKNNTIKKVEFLVKQDSNGKDNIYINKIKDDTNETSYMSKDTLFGKFKVNVTEKDDNGNDKIVKSGELPRILYYLLDLSGIFLDNMDVNISVVSLSIDLKNVVLSTIFDIMVADSDEKEQKESTNKIDINYLNGWDIKINKDNNLINGYIEGYVLQIVGGLSDIRFGSILKDGMELDLKINGKLKLSINQTTNSDDISRTEITLARSNKNLESAYPLVFLSFNYGDINFDLKVNLNESTFILSSTNNSNIVSNLKTCETLVTSSSLKETYVESITCPEIYIEFTFPVTLKVRSSYQVNFNN